MRPRSLLPAAFASAVVLAGGCADRVAGGSEIGNPGSIAGLAADSLGSGRAGVALRLLPADHDPFAAGPADTLRAVSDSQGRYVFSRVPAGAYVLTGKDPATGRRLLARVAAEAGARVEAGAAALRRPGRVVVEAGDGEVGTPVFLPGTPFRGRVDASGRAVLDSVPAGAAVEVARADGVAGARRLDTVAVPEGGAALAFASGPAASGRSRTVAPGEDLQAAVDSLTAGDTLYLAGGIWWLEHLRIDRRGRPGARITIRNRPGEIPVLRGTSAAYNLIHLNGAAYLDLEGLEIDSTLPGSDAIKLEEGDTSHHVALRGLHIHHVRGIAVNSQGHHHHIAVEGNHIHHTWGVPGTGIRVGDIGGAFAPSDWSIAGNWIHHCGFSVEEASGGIHVFTGARGMVIRDNILHDNAYAGIRFFGQSEENPAGTGLSLIEGNAVWNSGEAIAVHADAEVRNNVVFACTTLFRSRRYQDAIVTGKAPENLLIHHNTWHGGGAPEIRDWDAARNVVFSDNAVYATAAPWSIQGTGTLLGNVGDRPQAGFATGSADADLADPGSRLFHPKSGSALIGAGKGTLRADHDFDGRPREGRNDAGAYGYPSAGRPLREGFKSP